MRANFLLRLKEVLFLNLGFQSALKTKNNIPASVNAFQFILQPNCFGCMNA